MYIIKSLIAGIVLLLIVFFMSVFILRAVKARKDIWLKLKYSFAASAFAALLIFGIYLYGLSLSPVGRVKADMYIMKSLIVAIVLLLIAFFTVVFILRAVKTHKDIWLRLKYSLAASVLAVLLVLGIHIYGLNLYPFERELQPVLICEFSVPEEYELDCPGEKFWRGAYKIGNRESMFFDTDNRMSMYGFPWPPMDFEHFSYIITYGQKIESLSYNAWDTIDIPVSTGAIAGRMILDDEFHPEKVYIYSIPRLPIENDVSNVTGKALD